MFKSRIRSNGILRRQLPRNRISRERANLSFFIVIMFFAVFAIIVLTEVLLIDEKGRGQGVQLRKGMNGRSRYGDKSDYDDQGDDYFTYHEKNFDSNLAAFLRESGVDSHVAGRTHGKQSDKAVAGAPLPNLINIESRLPVLHVNQTAKDGEWQIVSGTRSKFFVYSAFYDKRIGRIIRLIGATKTRGPERVWCRLWYTAPTGNKTTTSSFSVPAKVKMIRENWNLRYSACFILCPLRHNLTVPTSVSIVSRLHRPPANHLVIRNTDKDPDLINRTELFENIAVCVKPLHFDYNKALEILEFIELNRMLGIEHFTLYNHTIGPQVSCILKNYQEHKVVTLLPWQINMKSQKEIRTENLFAALNDCLYRSMYRYAHIALVDLDEFIIPRYNYTITDMLRWMGTKLSTKSTGSYSFQNAFFYLQWKDDPTTSQSSDVDSKLITMRKTRRRTKLHPHKQRSKYICRPEFVIEAGNHFVWEFLPGHGTLNMPPEAGILNHYRVCEFGGDDCVRSASILDRTTFRYKEQLMTNVRLKWNMLKDKCNLSNLTK